MKHFLIILSVFTLSFSKIILTEIMYDPSGSEHHDEFIEIYNDSQDSIDLNGWSVSDNDERDMLIRYNGIDNMILPPRNFCVILDSSYYLNSTEYEELIPDTVLRIMINDGSMGKYGLSNSYPETVSIIDNNSVTSDSVTYTLDQESGYSEEKISFYENNWENSSVERGTPGFRNSVMPFNKDIEIYSVFIPDIDPEDHNTFTVKIINTGLDPFNGFLLNVYTDDIINSHENFTETLAPGDSVQIDQDVFFERSGTVEVKFELETDTDDDMQDNFYYTDIFVPFDSPPLVLNEFMKRSASGQCEYVEIYNLSNEAVRLGDFGVSDENKSNAVFFPDSLSKPGDFIVMAKDSLIFNFQNVLNSNVYIASKLPTLNVGTDKIFILTKDGLAIDSISYSGLDEDSGISIEKINPSLPSHDLNSWVYCVTEGTPTAKNSVFQEPEDVGSDANFKISPKTATPNGDGHDDNLMVSYEFDSAYVYLTMKIYNIKGQLIAKPLNGTYSASKGSYVWNCSDTNGRTIDTGAYICLIEAKDDNENIIELKEPFYIAK